MAACLVTALCSVDLTLSLLRAKHPAKDPAGEEHVNEDAGVEESGDPNDEDDEEEVYDSV